MVTTNGWDPAPLGRVPGRSVRRLVRRRHRPERDDRRARARRHADPAGVAGARGHRLAGAVRRRRAAPVRPRRRRRHPARRVAGRARADRRRLGRTRTREPRRARCATPWPSAADPVAAPAMQRYMKSTMPFRGVATPARRQLVRPWSRPHPPADRAEWVADRASTCGTTPSSARSATSRSTSAPIARHAPGRTPTRCRCTTTSW